MARKAIACELPRTQGVPLSRFSRAELHRLVVERGVCEASASTIHYSIVQRKLLEANDFADLAQLARTLNAFEHRWNEIAEPALQRTNPTSSSQHDRERTYDREHLERSVAPRPPSKVIIEVPVFSSSLTHWALTKPGACLSLGTAPWISARCQSLQLLGRTVSGISPAR